MKISEVIDKISKYHPPVDEEHTRDVVKIGDPNQECTGIVTTVFASVEVIRKTAALGANLIIVHEPLFYTDGDDPEWLQGNSVYEEKAALLKEHGIVVWRDHDRIHGGPMRQPREYTDMVFYGIMQELGWEKYCIGFDKKPLLYEIPETPLCQLAAELTAKFGLTGARIVGNPDTKAKRVFICEHVNGSNRGGHQADCEVIQEIDANDYDVMIPLEIVDWTLSEYVRDAAQLGKNKAIIEMGHFNVEELAMKHMEKWLPDVLGGAVPVKFVQAGDSFSYFVAQGAN